MDNNYQLQYLPLFYDDLLEKASYIRDDLSNPKAANDLLDAVEEAILERLPVCERKRGFYEKKRNKKTFFSVIGTSSNCRNN